MAFWKVCVCVCWVGGGIDFVVVVGWDLWGERWAWICLFILLIMFLFCSCSTPFHSSRS